MPIASSFVYFSFSLIIMSNLILSPSEAFTPNQYIPPSSPSSYPNHNDGSGVAKVWLTVSSLVDKVRVNGIKYTSQRKLELNWINVPVRDNGNNSNSNPLWIALFDKDQSDRKINSDDALVSIQPKTVSKGRLRSEVEFPIHIFTPSNLTSECLGFWIFLFDEHQIFAKDCIRSHPYWMEENMIHLKDKAIKDIMIPGTHNAGSYEIGFRSDSRNLLKKYVTCQDESVFNQLAYGIRYLDIRVSYETGISNRRDKLWIVHGILRTDVTLESVLHQVRAFLDATSAEVVILDFHRFEKGFEDHPRDQATNIMTKGRHSEVMQMIETILSDHIARDVSAGFNVRIGDLLAAGKRLLIGYAGNRFIREAQYYPRVRHLWAEADNASQLENYFTRMMCLVSGFEATSAMAQLTPSTWGVIFDKYGGLRKMAQDVNWLVTEWFDHKWWPCANIVSTDFFLGNNLIQISIEANRKRPPVPNRRFRRQSIDQDVPTKSLRVDAVDMNGESRTIERQGESIWD